MGHAFPAGRGLQWPPHIFASWYKHFRQAQMAVRSPWQALSLLPCSQVTLFCNSRPTCGAGASCCQLPSFWEPPCVFPLNVAACCHFFLALQGFGILTFRGSVKALGLLFTLLDAVQSAHLLPHLTRTPAFDNSGPASKHLSYTWGHCRGTRWMDQVILVYMHECFREHCSWSYFPLEKMHRLFLVASQLAISLMISSFRRISSIHSVVWAVKLHGTSYKLALYVPKWERMQGGLYLPNYMYPVCRYPEATSLGLEAG